MVYARKKTHYGDTHLKRRWRVRSRKRDLDQIDKDLEPKNSKQLLTQEVDLDKPGGAQHYCLHCARYFINSTALNDHFKTKVHKRRLKALEIEPYTIEDSQRAAGLGSWQAPSKRKIETQTELVEEESESDSKKMKVCDDVHRHYSALYITGAKATKHFAVLVPYVDFDKRLENKNELVDNVAARRLPVDVAKVIKRWQYFQFIDERKQKLELTRVELGRMIGNLMKNTEVNPGEIEKLKLHLKVVKEDLRNLKSTYHEVEEGAILKILKLPNVLHPKTPRNNKTIVHTFLDKIQTKSESHMIIGAKYLEYMDPFTCFLKSDAALFEQCILNYLRSCVQVSDYVQFSSPNFCRSIIAEGCGEVIDNNNKLFTLDELDRTVNNLDRLHLCGGSTLHSFMAYFARHFVPQSYFPMKFFSVGKKYQQAMERQAKSLFALTQEPVLNIFVATEEGRDELDSIISSVTTFYEALGYHFRMVLLPAHQLDAAESLRLSIQMFSNHLECYVEVGNISFYDNYLSKRLLFVYSSDKERKYPNVVAGTLVNVPKVLGCVLENNSFQSDAKLITDLLENHMFL